MTPWWDSPRVSKILMAFPGFKHCSCQSWWRKHTFLHGNAEKNVSFVVLDLNGTPRYMRELIPCWECSIDCYRRANSTHVSWLEFHHDVGVEIPEQLSPTIGFSPIKTHLWTCRFSAFFSWQLSLHCSPMKRFSKQTAWRLRGPAMKDGTTKIIQRLWGDAPSEPWWNSGIWNHKDKKSPFLFFGTEHVRLKTHM